MMVSLLRIFVVSFILSIIAPDVRSESPSASERSIQEYPISESDRDHWSFQPIREQSLPEVAHREWPINGIDRFTLAKMEAKSLTPSEPAGQSTLLRRLKFDLVGLPRRSKS